MLTPEGLNCGSLGCGLLRDPCPGGAQQHETFRFFPDQFLQAAGLSRQPSSEPGWAKGNSKFAEVSIFEGWSGGDALTVARSIYILFPPPPHRPVARALFSQTGLGSFSARIFLLCYVVFRRFGQVVARTGLVWASMGSHRELDTAGPFHQFETSGRPS